MKSHLALLALVISLPALHARADAPATATKYLPLQSRRPELFLREYSLEEKQKVLDQARLLLTQLYVHKDLKLNPGKAFQDIQTELDREKNQGQVLPVWQFHHELAKLFYAERDQHTTYYYPKPIYCYGTFLPFTLDAVFDAAGVRRIGVSSVLTDPAILAAAGADAAKIQAGDILLGYDGGDFVDGNVNASVAIPSDVALQYDERSPDDVLQQLLPISSRANEASGDRIGMGLMTFRYHMEHPFPGRDTVRMTLQHPTGAPYTVTLNWVSQAYTDCLKTAPPRPAAGQAIDGYMKKYNETFRHPKRAARAGLAELAGYPKPDAAADLSETGMQNSPTESNLHWKKLVLADYPGQTFGYLRLDSFSAGNSGGNTYASAQEFRRVLRDELSGTDGLIVDVRDNPGGAIDHAGWILQLFTPQIVLPEKFQMLTTPVNRMLVAVPGVVSPSFVASMQAATSQTPVPEFGEGVPFVEPVDANMWGQSYFKSVVVLTNGRCYSACDMFTAGMQDQDIGLIWGEDKHTGGGGAEVMPQSQFVSILAGNPASPFVALPDSQIMHVAWLQARRVGKHDGELIEGAGSLSDVPLEETRPLAEDLVLNDQVLVAKIAAKIVAKGPRRSSVLFPAEDQIDLPMGSPFTFKNVLVAGTDRVDFQANDPLVGSLGEISVPESDVPQRVDLAAPKKLPTNSSVVDIRGYLKPSTDPVWRKRLTVRYVPAPVSIAAATQAGLAGFTFYSSSADPLNQWVVKNGSLQIAGNTPHYAPKFFATASLFLAVPSTGKTVLNYNETVNSGAAYDYMETSVIVDGKTTSVGSFGGGVLAKTSKSINLATYAGKNIEFRIEFNAFAPGPDSTGPVISDFAVVSTP